MRHVVIEADPAELIAWLRGKPKQVAALQPSPAGPKMLSITVPSRDVIVMPAAIFSNVRSK
jgi:hypothetical protein